MKITAFDWDDGNWPISSRYMHQKKIDLYERQKQLPPLRSDEEAEAFVANADLTEYDLKGFRPARFELAPHPSRGRGNIRGIVPLRKNLWQHHKITPPPASPTTPLQCCS